MEYADHDYIIVCEKCEPLAIIAFPDPPEDYIVVCYDPKRCEFKQRDHDKDTTP